MLRESLPVDQKEDKRSGYYVVIDGIPKEVILGKRRGRPPTREAKNPAWFSMDRKVEACTLYAVYGSIEEVAKLTDIPDNHIRAWKQEPWWLDLTKQIYVEQNESLGANISKVLDKSLEHLADRLDNGDYVFNQKLGKVQRIQVSAKVLAPLINTLATQRRLNRGEPTSISAKLGTDERLDLLKQQFEKFSKAKEIEGQALDITEEENAIQQEV